MKKIICIMLIIIFSLLSAQQLDNSGSSSSDKPSFGTYAAEFGGAMAGSLIATGIGIGFFVLSKPEISISWNGSSGNSSSDGNLSFFVFSLISFVAVPAATAYGTKLVGEKVDPPSGKFWVSCGSAMVGMFCGGYLGYLVGTTIGKDPDESGAPILGAIIGAYIGNSISAVIGYNLSRNSGDDFGYHDSKFGLPGFGLRRETLNDGKTITALDFKLINARF